jgi:hypothetical protein
MFNDRQRAWIGGRAYSLRIDGAEPVEASKQATLEAQELFKEKRQKRKQIR